MRREHRKRGSVLMYVMIVGAILLVGVASMFGSINLTIASGEKFSRKESAKDEANSLIHKAVSQYKLGNLEFRETLQEENPHFTTTLTFETEGGPYSTNNLVSSSGTVGWNGQLVPPKSAHLVAVTEDSNQKKLVVEVLINQTALPWSVASNGSIQGNDMEVFSINSTEEAADAITDEEKQKSDILSNSSGAGNGNSIELSGSSKITGDAKAVAGISLLDSSTVEGKVQANADSVNITLDKRAEDYRPATGTSNVFDPSSSAPITGVYEASGDTVIGNLTFEDGMIFVDGNVTVTGDISGIGALVATGDITVTGSMNTSADLAALVSGGDISISGVGPNTSTFQGLILAEGSFKAKDTTLIGSALTLDQNGSVELERVRAVAAKDLTKVDLSYAVELEKAIGSNGGGGGSGIGSTEPIGILYQDNFTELSSPNYSALETLASQIVGNGSSEHGQVVVRVNGDYVVVSPQNASQIPPALLDPAGAAFDSWGKYEEQVRSNSVVYKDIFQLDFNKFLKTKGGFRPLIQRVTAF